MFRLNDFSNAFVKYEKVIESLCVVIFAICEDLKLCNDDPPFKYLFSLYLNFAACDLKLNKLNNVIEECSLILGVDKKNVF